jgi:multisubunit Na+/H+ antiporter MnhG subunit
MENKAKDATKRKIIGTILTIIGSVGLIYAGLSQFADGMNKNAAAGVLLFSLIVVFIGVGQLYKKHPDDY